MATHNNVEFKNDKTTDISFYIMFGSLVFGFVLLVVYIVYGFLG